jgi:hypothetical protein
MTKSKNLKARVTQAVRQFWQTRVNQDQRQGGRSGQRDAGNRTAATGGKQLDGFRDLICDLLIEAGLPESAVFSNSRQDVTLPGYFRPTKQWDVVVVVVANDCLLASVENKALCGPSFGNNYNNRVEEALGSSTDLWTAYREGAFAQSPRPFLGYLLLVEDAEGSQRPVRVQESHFRVFDEFRGSSYAQRCEECLRRLIRERCYDGACLILSNRTAGLAGEFREPASDLTFERFARLICNHTVANFRSL